ncbi:ABC transporter permease [Stenotrophomonas sp. MYb238]|uniref:ABC transporter permease n=1 Tax=Stenotrophomonas sp. MYb238 TaxID=2040281 RepID=UPI0012922852|nr:ABC transporter permease [Stenotrophomonas sp. MYb238]MQP74466.1 ABC transporter permease [Stenotrophomonas sp. MYb238]
MDTLPSSFPAAPASMPPGRVFAAYLQETRAECLRYLRSPSFLLPTLLFPAVFFLMFGVVLAGHSTPEAPRFLLASYSTFGVMAPGLFGFGMSLALERDNGLLTLKRALPMPPAAYLIGKMAMAMLVAALITALLQTLGLTLAHVQLQAPQMLRLALVCIAGAVPFCALGLLLGTLVKGQGAPAMVNLLYLPMAFLSGLWFPLQMLPPLVRAQAPLWPSYHLNALAQSAVGFDTGSAWPHLLWLAVFTLVVLAIAVRRLRRHG